MNQSNLDVILIQKNDTQYMYYNRNAEQWGAVQTIIIRFGDFLMISDQNEVTMRVWVHMTKAYISFYNQPINLPPGCGRSTMP